MSEIQKNKKKVVLLDIKELPIHEEERQQEQEQEQTKAQKLKIAVLIKQEADFVEYLVRQKVNTE
jgi:hypothetical protein